MDHNSGKSSCRVLLLILLSLILPHFSASDTQVGGRIHHASAPLFNRAVLVVGGEFVDRSKAVQYSRARREPVAIYEPGVGWVSSSRVTLQGSFENLSLVGHSLKPVGEANVTSFDAGIHWPAASEQQDFVVVGGISIHSQEHSGNSSDLVHKVQVSWNSTSDHYSVVCTSIRFDSQSHLLPSGDTATPAKHAALISFSQFSLLVGGFSPFRFKDFNGRVPSLEGLVFVPHTAGGVAHLLDQLPPDASSRPGGRSGHSLHVISHSPGPPTNGTSVHTSTALLFGGVRYNHANANTYQAKVEYLRDLWELTVTQSGLQPSVPQVFWRRLFSGYEVGIVQPPPRAFHGSYVKNGRLYVHGGLQIIESQQGNMLIHGDAWEYDPGTNSWTDVTGASTVARAHHTTTYLSVSDTSVTIGGMVQQANGGGILISSAIES